MSVATNKIIKMPSNNRFQGRHGWKPDMIVNHVTEGTAAGAISWLRNPKSQASANFHVARNGVITELVPITDAAWCNGTGEGPRYNYNNSLIPEIRRRRTNANYYTVSIEHEGYSYKELFGGLTEVQYQATLWLHKYIITEVKRLYSVDIPIDRQHIIGHYQVAPREKPKCPGDKFPWNRLISDLQAWRNVVRVNYRGRLIEVSGYVKDGRNHVQIRELLEKMGFRVNWDNKTKTVLVR